jgi:hypothetical protein
MKRSAFLTLLLSLPLAAVSIAQTAMPMPAAKPPVAPADSLTVNFNGNTTIFNRSTLSLLPQQTVTAFDGHTQKNETFTGPLVTDVLAKAGLIPGDKTHALILRSYVTATGTDGYFVIYSGAELEPMFTSGKAIIALTADGAPVASGIQLVNPLDIKPARWVHGLTTLTVTTTTAPPAK